MSNLNTPTNLINLPNGVDTANNNPVTKALKVIVENINATGVQGNSVEDYLLYLYNSVRTNEDVDLYETVIMASGGDDANDGSNDQNAVQSYLRATELTRAMLGTDHKTIFSKDTRNFLDLTNNNTTGNTPNLIVYTPFAWWEDVTLTEHVTSLYARKIIGNIILGNGSSVNANVLGHTTTKTITFAAEVHTATELKSKHINSNTTLSFAGVSANSHIHIEIDRYENTIQDVLDTIPDDVKVTGFIEGHFFIEGGNSNTDNSAVNNLITTTKQVLDQVYILQNKVSENIFDIVSPNTNQIMIGANNNSFLASGGSIDESHFSDVFSMWFNGFYMNNKLKGILKFDKYANGANFPTNFYFRDNGTTIVPTTNGTDTALSDLRGYIGNSERMWHTTTFNFEKISETSKSHSLAVPENNIGSEITTIGQSHHLQLIFNFADFDVDVAEFTGRMILYKNSGDKNEKYDGKTRVKFTRMSTNHYTILLGTDSVWDSVPIQVSDVFNNQTHTYHLNTGGHTNQVSVNGEVTLSIPYFPNGEQVFDILFDVDTVAS